MLQIAVLVSGGGTNLQAIIDKINSGELDCKINRVISDNKDAYALERAKKHNIDTKVIEFNKDFNENLLSALEESGAELIVAAGFLKVLSSEIIHRYRHKIVNIHPSLIPSFCGKGFYGIKVHEKALERGIKITGATVHFVDEGTDTGPIIMQQAVSVMDDDTPQSLQKRVMEEAEQVILPDSLKLIAEGRVYIENGKAKIRRIIV